MTGRRAAEHHRQAELLGTADVLALPVLLDGDHGNFAGAQQEAQAQAHLAKPDHYHVVAARHGPQAEEAGEAPVDDRYYRVR